MTVSGPSLRQRPVRYGTMKMACHTISWEACRVILSCAFYRAVELRESFKEVPSFI